MLQYFVVSFSEVQLAVAGVSGVDELGVLTDTVKVVNVRRNSLWELE